MTEQDFGLTEEEKKIVFDSELDLQKIKLLVVASITKSPRLPLNIASDVVPISKGIDGIIGQTILLVALNTVCKQNISKPKITKMDFIAHSQSMIIEKGLAKIYEELNLKDGDNILKELIA